jgi:hypothetical protein
MEYNISKIKLKILGGFCRNTDLGILLFNFLSKNYSSKVYTYWEKVVVLVTLSTKKIGFAVFRFFCGFIRILQVAAKSTQSGKNRFAKRPLKRLNCSQICP